MQPPDQAPPLKLLAWLKAQGFDPFDFPGAPPGSPQLYRRNGDIYAWDEAPGVVSDELQKECNRLRDENAKLKLVTPRPGILTSEFLLNAGGIVVVGVIAAQGQIEALADTLGPTAATALKALLAIIVAGAGNAYMSKRKADKSVEAEAKKQITQSKEMVP